MYVYRTSKFNEELNRIPELSSRVENLCSHLETMNYLDAKARFKKLHLYLKRKEGNFRLIARILKIEREPILCFLKVYNRGEPGYKRFLEDIKQNTELFNESKLKPELVEWLTREKRRKNTSQPNLSLLPDNLRIWLELPNWKIEDDDLIIHETEIWYKKFNQPAIRSQASHYLELIEAILNNHSLGEDTGWKDIKLYCHKNLSIIYSILDNTENLSQKILLLIAPYIGNPTEPEIQKIIQRLSKKTNVIEKFGDFAQRKPYNSKLIVDDLITSTKRSYPSYLVLEEDFWLKIQDGNGVNLTLSDEEKEILNSVSTDKPLPLFLNGRAGSGKSTLLFYLFAYYCNQHLQLCHEQNLDILEQPHPLFLTYSNNLSDFAKDKVQFLLRHHHLFVEDTSKLQNLPDLKPFFQPFRFFLLNILPPEVRKLFPQESYVSFYNFKQFCAARWQTISPEKCWLVIQNFIKGYELDERDSYLEDEHYYSEIVPKKARIISVEEFIEIRDRVWKAYKQHLKRNHLWDDRDLIRTVLSLGCYEPKYTAIFCDEAQDFTRLELQLIMRLSVFSRYDLEQERIFSLPFACAGDPLQTLNPTGFRWESFKAAFYDEVLTPLDLNHQSSLKIELTPLKYNYRSVASIVKVNNLIQLWRKVLFNLDDINPQKSRKVNNIVCQKFIIKDNSAIKNLHQYLKNVIILIPCDEGEENNFIKNDELLRNFIDREKPRKLPWNILSAISAKGLEFKQVVLYKFGERCPKKVWEIKEQPPEKEKYFLNKLYVAASRATEALFIIDSLDGERNLWRYASEPDKINYFLSHIENNYLREQWRENTDLIYPSESLETINHNDLEANALTFQTVGIQGENIDYLERAIAAYEASNNLLKAKLCQAWKLKLEKRLRAAGKLFFALGNLTESWYCFWQALAWKELKEILLEPRFLNSKISKQSRLELLSPLIEFMVNIEEIDNFKTDKLALSKFGNFTDFLILESQQKLFLEEYHNQPWENAIAAYKFLVQKFIAKPKILAENNWQKIAQVVLNWNEDTSARAYIFQAQCLTLSKDYHQALTYWEKAGYPEKIIDNEDRKKYYLVKAKLTPLPQALEYLAKAEKYPLLINVWFKYGKSRDGSWLKYVAIAYEATNHFEQAFIIYHHLDDPVKVEQCWEQINPPERKIKYLKKILNYYLAQQHWQQALSLVEKYVSLNHLPYIFVCNLGQSQLLPHNLNNSERQSYQQFIQQHILHNGQWQNYFTPQYLGIVLEKIGSFLEIFSFYGQYTNSSDANLCEFSRRRWLATKLRQITYLQNTHQIAQLQKAQKKLTNFANKWQIKIETVSPSIPLIQLEKPHKRTLNNLSKVGWKVIGLPSHIDLKTIAHGVYQFQLHHFIVRLIPTTKQIAIADTLTGKIVSFDGRGNKLQIDTTTITLSNNQQISLSETLGNYTLTVQQQDNLTWELTLKDYSEKITIQLKNCN